MRHGVGVSVSVAGDPFVALFSESTGRALVSVRGSDVDAVTSRCDELAVPVAELGRTGGTSLIVTPASGSAASGSAASGGEGALFTLSVETLRASWTPTLRNALA